MIIQSTSLCLVFAFFAPAPVLSALTPPLAGEERAVDDAGEKRRVLELSSGQKIRVVSRFANERWEYKSKGEWKQLERGAVVGAALESDLLKTWNEKRGALDVKDQTQRVLLAEWAAGAGLITESLKELEAVLGNDPDSTGARETLAKHWFFSVPKIAGQADVAAAEEELLRFGASQTLAGRELASLELARHPDKAALLSRLASELRSPIVVRRSFATLVLRRVFPGEEVKQLMVRSVFDASADVRRGCALGLKAVHDPSVCVPIVRALNSQYPIVRTNAAEALGYMGYSAAVEPLITALAAPAGGGGGDRLPHSNIFVGRQFAYVQDFDVQVAQFQAVADPVINVVLEGSVMDTAVAGETDYLYSSDSVVIQNSLSKLTNEMPGRSAKAWITWWEKNGAKWRAEDLSRPKTG
jgi:hypothetical protein